MEATGIEGRHHLDPIMVHNAVKNAVEHNVLSKAAGCHIFCHSQRLRHAGLRPGSATHVLGHGQEIRIIQELIGNLDLNTTMVFAQVLKRGPIGVSCPSFPL
jgi:site-specific recombinase XerD